MSFISQIFSVAWLSIRTIRERLGSSAVAVVGIAGVVIVFVAVLSIAEGFSRTMESAGASDRAIVMRGGAARAFRRPWRHGRRAGPPSGENL